jgi:hypothetical protein
VMVVVFSSGFLNGSHRLLWGSMLKQAVNQTSLHRDKISLPWRDDRVGSTLRAVTIHSEASVYTAV